MDQQIDYENRFKIDNRIEILTDNRFWFFWPIQSTTSNRRIVALFDIPAE